MKKYLFIFVLITLVISSTSVFAAGLSANRILNPGFDQDTWWGGGLVLAYRWGRSPADNLYNHTTTEAYTGNGALFVAASPSQTTTGWTSDLRIAVKPSATYTCSVWAKWDACSTANGIQMNIIVYDDSIPGSIIGTYNAIATTGSSGGNWVKLTGSFAAPSNAVCATVFLGTVGANTETWILFDEVKMQAEDDPNLLINPGFEAVDTTYAGAGTYWRRNTSIGRASWTSFQWHTGTACTWVMQSASAGYRMWYNAQGATRSYVAIEQNKSYLYGGWMTWDFITVGAAGIGIQWFDGQLNTLNGDSGGAGGGDLTLPPNMTITVTDSNLTWTYLVATATPPVSAKFARLILWNASTAIQPTGAEAISWYDDVVFKDLPPVVSITPSSLNISLGKTQIFGANGGTAPYTWTSSDTAVGSIDAASGLFTALSLGPTTITATDNDGFTATAAVVVIATKAPIFAEPQSATIQRIVPFGELYE